MLTLCGFLDVYTMVSATSPVAMYTVKYLYRRSLAVTGILQFIFIPQISLADVGFRTFHYVSAGDRDFKLGQTLSCDIFRSCLLRFVSKK